MNMKRQYIIGLRTLVVFFLVSVTHSRAASSEVEKKASDKPNIIFILADDLGIGNVSCYGADNFKTPNIDALAKNGTRFERSFACPLCGPSRALLMTGRYAYHTGMTSNDNGPLLKPEKETMTPRILKPAGYATAMCGKWSQLPLQPSDWGFDEYLRFNGSGKYWNTQANNKTYTRNGQEIPLGDGEYLPDTMQAFVFDFIKRHKETPFYVYYALSHVHAEILPTPDTAPGTTNPMTLYQDNVSYMDKLVGHLVSELDRLGIRDKTLILFAGDNGTANQFAEQSTIGGKHLSGQKGTMLECGALIPCIANWPGKIPAGKVTKALVDFSDILPTLAGISGAALPPGLLLDGKDFGRQLLGREADWPREWIFVELGKHWYDRDAGWKLNEAGELFDMKDSPFSEPLVPADTQDETAVSERKRLQGVLDKLSPASGYVDQGDGSGRHAKNVERLKKKQEKKAKNEEGTNASMNSQNANAPDQ
jgi:arylsulfatase A